MLAHSVQGAMQKLVGRLAPAGLLGYQVVHIALLVLEDSHAPGLDLLPL